MPNERNLSVAMRPSKFEDCIGNNNIITQIRTQLDSHSIPTAFLLSGPTGVGKTTLARCISARLNGELVETNAADDTGVDAARVLGEASHFRPLTGDYKVIVLDEAHQLTKQAQNALLKYVEDAPPSTIWIFCTTEPSKIIPTLRSRCISFALSGLGTTQIALLVYRGIQHLGKKGDEKTEELIQLLVRENITTPRAILMATERFIGGADPLGAVFGTETAPQAFEIARAAAKQDWDTIRKALSQSSSEEAIAIRAVVISYFKSMLLRGTKSDYIISSAIIELTATIPFNSSLELPELSARLHRICTNLDKIRR